MHVFDHCDYTFLKHEQTIWSWWPLVQHNRKENGHQLVPDDDQYAII